MSNDYTVLSASPVVLNNRTCPYCTVVLNENNCTKEHVVGRRFVPKGKFNGQWNLILNACLSCNSLKSDLEDDVSAITMQPDVAGVHAVDDQILRDEAIRKGRTTSRLTKKRVSDSGHKLTVEAPILGGASMRVEFVAPPQLDKKRAAELAAFHVDAFSYWATFDNTERIGHRVAGESFLLFLCGRADWGNAGLRKFMDRVVDWDPIVIAPAAAGFFKIAIRRHRAPECLSWALEWNHNYRLVGLIGEEDRVRTHAAGLDLPESHTIMARAGRVSRYRIETPLPEAEDTLFSWNDSPSPAALGK